MTKHFFFTIVNSVQTRLGSRCGHVAVEAKSRHTGLETLNLLTEWATDESTLWNSVRILLLPTLGMHIRLSCDLNNFQ
jgi:hypothetical protein